MTKVSVFGEKPTKKKKLKKIECVKYVGSCGNTFSVNDLGGFENLKLFEKGIGYYDVILAFDGTESNPDSQTVILGHWNDGVV